jgi:hypothetical protein
MATTTNYGWTTPDDTALVKDGAAAIRTLGSSVDTTTKNLNPETTLGDIAYRSSTANVKTRLGLGTAGQVLQVNSGATAPEWATPSSGGLTLISTTTLSGASVTLSSIPSTYKHLQLIISGVTANTSNSALRILPNNVSNLANGTGQRGFPGGPDAPEYSNNAILPYLVNDSLRTNANNTVQLTIYNYASSTQIKSFMSSYGMVRSTGVNNYAVSGGSFVSTTAITSLVIDYGGSNTFTGGEVLFYGVS